MSTAAIRVSPTRLPFRTIARTDRSTVSGVILCIFVAIILFVSMNDVYWSFKTRDTLLEDELNPIGRWLIRLDDGDIALFMTAKMLGTIVVVMVLPWIYRIRRRMGLLVAMALTCFQIALFLQLNFDLPILTWI